MPNSLICGRDGSPAYAAGGQRVSGEGRRRSEQAYGFVTTGRARAPTNLLAMIAKTPRTQPEMTPITGPVSSIITRGCVGSGIDAIIAASRGWFAMYRLNSKM